MLDLLHLECFSVICNWLVIVELKLLNDNLKMQTAFKKVKLTLSCCFKHASVTNTSPQILLTTKSWAGCFYHCSLVHKSFTINPFNHPSNLKSNHNFLLTAVIVNELFSNFN